MERRKLTKEDIDKVRVVEGFPLGTDEDIIALSDAPYYTACPNPFLGEFIEKYGSPYDEATDTYHCEPYTEDLSEDKHGLIYNIHGYHTKVPPEAIEKLICHYTKPGDLVFDGFCGSGMTGIAAQLCAGQDGARSAIVSDISACATFIAQGYNNPNDGDVINEIRKIIDDVCNAYGEYYQTIHLQDGQICYDIQGNPVMGTTNYVVWSNIYICPHCGAELNYYNVMMENGVTSKEKMIRCPHCNAMTERSKLDRKEEIYYDEEIGDTVKLQAKVPVLINYTVGKSRETKVPDQRDLDLLKKIQKTNIKWHPMNKMIHGVETERLFRAGITYVKQLYTPRTLFFLSEIYDRIRENNKMIFWFTSALAKMTILNRYMPEHGSRALVGPRAGTYYLPNMFVENSVIRQLEFQLKKLQNLQYSKGQIAVTNQSCDDLSNIPDNSVDYEFVDPPFGGNIMYSELNYIVESWLRVFTQNKEEAVINKAQKKGTAEYQALMTRCFEELYRVLKPNRWISVEFHNSHNSIWMAIQQAIGMAGFIIADVRTLDKNKKTVNQFTAAGCVNQDLIISAYKPNQETTESIIRQAGTEETVWTFVRQHLEHLPVVVDADKNGKIDIIQERKAFLLFDRMVAWHLMHGVSVPMDATEFYRGLDDHFLKRDDMYFLPDQVNEYDQKRSVMELENIEMAFAIQDEKGAIQWLNYQLTEPQTYQDLQPKYLQELHQLRSEKMPELMDLLRENFLQDEDGKWYVPDITKAGDVAKLRQKSLLKEFESYLQTKGKLKVFRSEAIRAGFDKLWKEQDYKTIVSVAERLPEKTIQEDANLLMYYDLSTSRV